MVRQATLIRTKCDYCGKEYLFKGGLNNFLRWDHHSCSYECSNKLKAQSNNNGNGRAERINPKSDVPKKCLEFTTNSFECPLDDRVLSSSTGKS
jgi:hypothetical protein